ncbi:MAG: hypothetical protein PWP24_675 [Clostridiales bacterium]|nr:hypothetical protein [Clostridiales bacterium]
MKISEKSKKIICLICFFLFFVGGGFNPNIYLESYLPREIFHSIILEDSLKLIAFVIMLSIFEPLEVEYKSRKYKLIIIIDIVIVFYLCYSYFKILV